MDKNNTSRTVSKYIFLKVEWEVRKLNDSLHGVKQLLFLFVCAWASRNLRSRHWVSRGSHDLPASHLESRWAPPGDGRWVHWHREASGRGKSHRKSAVSGQWQSSLYKSLYSNPHILQSRVPFLLPLKSLKPASLAPSSLPAACPGCHHLLPWPTPAAHCGHQATLCVPSQSFWSCPLSPKSTPRVLRWEHWEQQMTCGD